MSRQYKIVTDITTAVIEETLAALRAQHRTFEVHGGVEWDGTNYIVLVSFEV